MKLEVRGTKRKKKIESCPDTSGSGEKGLFEVRKKKLKSSKFKFKKLKSGM